MLPLTELTNVLQEALTMPNIRILLDIIESFYCVEGKITTRSISRYTQCHLRTLFRFLKTPKDWISIKVMIFKAFAFNEKDVYIVVVDEVVEGKSRKKSYGIDNFYSSICGQAIRSISFCGLSLVNVNTRTSYNLGVEQLVYTTADKARIKESKTKKKEREKRKKESGTALQKGRKKGQKNKGKEENLTVSYRVLKSLLSAVIICLSKYLPVLKIRYLVCDAAYATQDYMDFANSQSLFLISRLRDNPALFMTYDGPYKGFGRKSKYGERYDLKNLDNSYLKKTEEKDDCTYYTYQIQAWSKSIKKYLLNVVVIKAVQKESGKIGFKVLVSNDLQLDFEKIVDYYSLRFQIEFDFRDAKQHFGLSDFKNYKEQNLTNFVNLSFLMCLINKILLDKKRKQYNIPKLNTADLKVIFRRAFTTIKLIKLLRNTPELIFNDGFFENLLPEELIHRA